MATFRRPVSGVCVIVLLTAAAAFAEPPRIGAPEPKPHAPRTVRIASYNLENLFDNKDDPSLSGKDDDMMSVKPESERKALGEVIRRLDADVLACEEVESYDALIEFREQHLKGAGYNYVQSIDVGAERGIEQAVMSRYPIVHAEVWPVLDLGGAQPPTLDGKKNEAAGKPLVGRRSPLAVTVEVPAEATGGKPYFLTLLVVHQKSGRDFSFWREAESEAFVKLVKQMEQRDPKANIVVLGDFNASPDQKSVKIFTAAGLTDVFAPHGDKDPLWITHSSGRIIDHLLVNANLQHELIPGSEFVLGTPQLKPEEDWRTAKKPDGYASDHLPIAVDLKPVDE